MSELKKWTIHSEKCVEKTPIFSLHQMSCSSQTQPDKKGEFVYLNSPNWVNVIAVTPEKKVVFVEQYRHGIRDMTLEIPGGLCDEGESFLEAGCRELREETGFVGRDATYIGTVQPNPAFMNNKCTTIVVYDAVQKLQQELDPTEEIKVHLYTLEQVHEGIRSGHIQNAMVVAAFHFFTLHMHKMHYTTL